MAQWTRKHVTHPTNSAWRGCLQLAMLASGCSKLLAFVSQSVIASGQDTTGYKWCLWQYSRAQTLFIVVSHLCCIR
jgi:hypothetical protein